MSRPVYGSGYTIQRLDSTAYLCDCCNNKGKYRILYDNRYYKMSKLPRFSSEATTMVVQSLIFCSIGCYNFLKLVVA